MPDRIGHRFKSSRTRVPTAWFALSVLMLAPDAGWPQGGTQPSLGVQSPAQQPGPQGPPPQQIEPPPAPPAERENPGLINEIGKLLEKSKTILPSLKSPGETMEDLNTRAKDAGQGLSNMARPSLMVTGRGLPGSGQRRAGLQGGGR
jgi:hypothetical protein